MANFEDRVVQNINSLIYLLRSQGIKAISTTKFIRLLNKNFRVALDDQGLANILSKNDAVTDIVDDKIIIDGKAQEDEDNANDDVHDAAVDQAGDNLTSESLEYKDVVKIYESLKVGDKILAKSINLDESFENYFIHKGARLQNKNYVIESINPCLSLKDSKIHCKIEDTQIYLDIPFTSLI